jgi:O-antigen/teichoic acid export membrane protein
MFAQLKQISPGLQKIIRNSGWLLIERVVGIISTLVIGIYVIRYLGPKDIGTLSYASSFVALFTPIAKLGLDSIAIRNIVKDESSTPEILGTSFVLKLAGALVSIFLIFIVVLNQDSNSQEKAIVLILSLTVLFDASDVINFWYQAKVKSGGIVLVRIIQVILSLSVKIIFIALKSPLIYFVWLLVFESIFRALGFLCLYSKLNLYVFTKWRFNKQAATTLLIDSFPLIFSNFMIVLYVKIDQVMLGNMSTNSEVGFYAAAVKFSEMWYLIPSVIIPSLVPAIIKSKEKGKESYRARLQQLYDLMSWLSWIIVIPMTFLSKFLILYFLGNEFVNSIPILSLHIWATPFVFLGCAQNQWLIIENLTHLNFLTTLLGAISNIILNLFFIPKYGGMGAALATVISYSLSSYFSCFIFSEMRSTGLMLTKALFIPFRIRDNLSYLHTLSCYLNK